MQFQRLSYIFPSMHCYPALDLLHTDSAVHLSLKLKLNLKHSWLKIYHSDSRQISTTTCDCRHACSFTSSVICLEQEGAPEFRGHRKKSNATSPVLNQWACPQFPQSHS